MLLFFRLYIVLFLHQTTTSFRVFDRCICCISYYSYIKPQLQLSTYIYPQVVYRTIPTSNHNFQPISLNGAKVVYRTIPTSNHNEFADLGKQPTVVYRTIPTSNHNVSAYHQINVELYIVLFLHQTTTRSKYEACSIALYIVLFLHQTTTETQSHAFCECCISYYSYIKPQLLLLCKNIKRCCISYYSYIKPQRVHWLNLFLSVVYRTIPTSNHNYCIAFY